LSATAARAPQRPVALSRRCRHCGAGYGGAHARACDRRIGVLGNASIPLLRDAGHTVDAPGRTQLDLFDPEAVAAAVADKDAVLHLATRIPPPERLADREAWRDTDRLRTEATPILVDAALATSVEWFLFPAIAFVYPESGTVDESTPVADEVPEILLSALDAERHVARFDGGRRGVVLRLGVAYGATLRIEDAGSAIAAAAEVPGGVYNVVSDGERVSDVRFKGTAGWRPEF
jgi:nucleoside-diphosphate-sugar epimerase